MLYTFFQIVIVDELSVKIFTCILFFLVQIEILFKKFKYSLDDITPAEVLRDHNRLNTLETQLIFLVNGNAPAPVSGTVAPGNLSSTAIVSSNSTYPSDYGHRSID